jgi:hypothetical protein
MLGWFTKAAKTKAEEVVDKASSDKNINIQGSYTDHHMTPYQLREQIEPMYGEELKAFHWVIAKMEKDHPDLTRLDDLIDAAFDDRWFILGEEGELRVTQEAP